MQQDQNKYGQILKLLMEGVNEEWVRVRVAHPDQIQTVINMVQNTKSRKHQARKIAGLPGLGRLEIRREPEKLQVFFRLKNAGCLL